MKYIEIYAMRCGTVGTDETIPDKSKSRNPYAYTGVLRSKKHKVWLPVYTYLIIHPEGKILVDTGWHTEVRQNQKQHMSWKLNIASKALLPEGEAVTEQLRMLGITPKEVDYVLLTHLDVDHVSGLELVKDACYNRQSWEWMRFPGITVNREKAERALKWVHDMAQREECEEILATHDPEIMPHKIIL